MTEVKLNATSSPDIYRNVPRQLVPQFSTESCDDFVMGSNNGLYLYSLAPPIVG